MTTIIDLSNVKPEDTERALRQALNTITKKSAGWKQAAENDNNKGDHDETL